MPVASGTLAGVSKKSKALRHAFTLIELLVTLGIITVLISILMPLLSRVREMGRRAKCSANLHTIGQAATAFANDHNGLYPVAYRMIDQVGPPGKAYPWRIPNFIAYPNANPAVPTDNTLEHDNDNNPLTGWQANGTSWRVWCQYLSQAWKTDQIDKATQTVYGLSIFTCPSAGTPPQWTDYSSTIPQYGSVIDTNYIYVGGLSDTIDPTVTPPVASTNLGHGSMAPQANVTGGNQSRSHWGTTPPATQTLGSPVYGLQQVSPSVVYALNLGVARPSACILAADMVFFGGYTSPISNEIYRINHPQSGNPRQPDFQNVLYGDGRVEGLGRDNFSKPLYDDSGSDPTGAGASITASQFNYSLKFSDTNGGYYYWGEYSATPAQNLVYNSADIYIAPVFNNGAPGSGPTNQVPPPPPNIPPPNNTPIGEGNPGGTPPG